jgi:hypothetical protein
VFTTGEECSRQEVGCSCSRQCITTLLKQQLDTVSSSTVNVFDRLCNWIIYVIGYCVNAHKLLQPKVQHPQMQYLIFSIL